MKIQIQFQNHTKSREDTIENAENVENAENTEKR